MRRPDHRADSFAKAYDELVYIHERMAENGTHFAASLQQMHDDLVDLAASSERSRKTWKTNGLAAEQKVVDLEQAMRKSKSKYDSLADEYERARTGEGRQTGKVLNAFKNKSAAQQEEDLLKKVQAADQSYHGHVQTLQTEKSHLESTTRPEAIKAVQDLIKELDEGLTLQMQKFGMRTPFPSYWPELESPIQITNSSADLPQPPLMRSCCLATASALALSRGREANPTLLRAVFDMPSCRLTTREISASSWGLTAPRSRPNRARSSMSATL